MSAKEQALSKIVQLCVGAIFVATAPLTFAGNTWTGSNFGNLCNGSSGLPSTGWTNCPAATDPAFKGLSTGTGTNTNPSTSATFGPANVYDYDSSGLGVVNLNDGTTTGPHALDNYNGQDAFVFRFDGGPVTLTSIVLGWNGTDNPTSPSLLSSVAIGNPSSVSGKKTTYTYLSYNDSDMALWAYTGAGDPTTVANFGPGLAGWEFIGEYNDVGASNGIGNTTARQGGTATISSSVYSSYWMVTTAGLTETTSTQNSYTTNNGTKKYTTVTNTINVDAFKVLALAGHGCTGTVTGGACRTGGTPGSSVPEPGSMALLAAGMLGMVAVRRRRQHTHH